MFDRRDGLFWSSVIGKRSTGAHKRLTRTREWRSRRGSAASPKATPPPSATKTKKKRPSLPARGHSERKSRSGARLQASRHRGAHVAGEAHDDTECLAPWQRGAIHRASVYVATIRGSRRVDLLTPPVSRAALSREAMESRATDCPSTGQLRGRAEWVRTVTRAEHGHLGGVDTLIAANPRVGTRRPRRGPGVSPYPSTSLVTRGDTANFMTRQPLLDAWTSGRGPPRRSLAPRSGVTDGDSTCR